MRKAPLVGFIDNGKIAQINKDFYLFNGYDKSLTCYSDINLLNGTNNKSQKASPMIERGNSCGISTYAEEYIFVSGGSGSIKTAEYYSVKNNNWTKAPEMNDRRWYHSQCTLDDYLYVFFGMSYDGKPNSIEWINARKVISGIPINWSLI